jgi:uncharacterized membrane protein
MIKWAAMIVSVVGIVDAVYLTAHHYSREPVPCDLVSGCETVLTSSYAEIGGVPLAAFGLAAYFAAFCLAVLAAYGNTRAWTLFGIHTAVMAAVSVWLIYVQAAVLNAFCQFCLLSAATTFTLFALFIVSVVKGRKPTEA